MGPASVGNGASRGVLVNPKDSWRLVNLQSDHVNQTKETSYPLGVTFCGPCPGVLRTMERWAREAPAGGPAQDEVENLLLSSPVQAVPWEEGISDP